MTTSIRSPPASTTDVRTVAKVAIGLLALLVATAGGGLAVVALEDDDDRGLPAVDGIVAVPALERPGRGGGDDDRPLSATETDRAVAAALEITGGGTVVEVDRSDDPGEAYELEVVKDGREIDVALDGEFRGVPNRRYDD